MLLLKRILTNPCTTSAELLVVFKILQFLIKFQLTCCCRPYSDVSVLEAHRICHLIKKGLRNPIMLRQSSITVGYIQYSCQRFQDGFS